MKKIRLERVSIVREVQKTRVSSPYDWRSRKKHYEKVQSSLDCEALGFDKWSMLFDKKMRQYEQTLKVETVTAEKTSWKVIGSDGRLIGKFDSLEQAKRHCVKNNLDYGYF